MLSPKTPRSRLRLYATTWTAAVAAVPAYIAAGLIAGALIVPERIPLTLLAILAAGISGYWIGWRLIDPTRELDIGGALFLGIGICLLAYYLLGVLVGALYFVPQLLASFPLVTPSPLLDLLVSVLATLAAIFVATPALALIYGIPPTWPMFPVAMVAALLLKHLVTARIVAGLVLLVVLLFVGGSAYGRWRMDQVDQGLFQLAAQLGYTPERFIRHQLKSRDVNVVTGSAYCTSELYFTTPMGVDEFGRRLDEVLPDPNGQLRVGLPDPNTHLYSALDLTVNGVDVSSGENGELQTPVSSYHGSRFKRDQDLYLTFYATMNLSPTLAYGEHPIGGNLVRLYQEGGVFPFWVMCPGRTTYTPPSAAVDLGHDAAAGRSVAMRVYYGAMAAVGGAGGAETRGAAGKNTANASVSAYSLKI